MKQYVFVVTLTTYSQEVDTAVVAAFLRVSDAKHYQKVMNKTLGINEAGDRGYKIKRTELR